MPLRAGAGFLDPVSESESQMDLSGFLAFGAGGFLLSVLEGFLAAEEKKISQKHLISCDFNFLYVHWFFFLCSSEWTCN